ncbi:hypothetical protein BKI52_21440 [marine bacterium AO1-C]|nr:hypothetical protein BKI52_21440 [marine bacterium AO1-C]
MIKHLNKPQSSFGVIAFLMIFLINAQVFAQKNSVDDLLSKVSYYWTLQKYSEAIKWAERAQLETIRISGRDKTYFGITETLVKLYEIQNKFPRSIPLRLELKKYYEKKLSLMNTPKRRKHGDYLDYIEKAAANYFQIAKRARAYQGNAQQLLKDALAYYQKDLPNFTKQYVSLLKTTGYIYEKGLPKPQYYQETEAICIEGLKNIKAQLGVANDAYDKILRYLIELYKAQKAHTKAVALFEKTIPQYKKTFTIDRYTYFYLIKSFGNYVLENEGTKQYLPRIEKLYRAHYLSYQANIYSETRFFEYVIDELFNFYKVGLEDRQKANQFLQQAKTDYLLKCGPEQYWYKSIDEKDREIVRKWHKKNKTNARDFSAKVKALEGALEFAKANFGLQSHIYVATMAHLSNVYLKEAKERADKKDLVPSSDELYQKAAAYYKTVVAGYEKIKGVATERYAESLTNHGYLLQRKKFNALSNRYLKRAKALYEKHGAKLKSKINDIDELIAQNNNAQNAGNTTQKEVKTFVKSQNWDVLYKQSIQAQYKQQYPKAIQLGEKAYKLAQQQKDGPGDYDHLITHLGALYYSQKKYAAAEAMYVERLKRMQQILKVEQSAAYTTIETYIIACLSKQEKYVAAEAMATKSLPFVEKTQGPDAYFTLQIVYHLEEIYKNTKAYDKLEKLYQQHLAKIAQKNGIVSKPYQIIFDKQRTHFLKQKRYAQAEQFYKTQLATYTKTPKRNESWRTDLQKELIEVYQQQGKQAQANALNQQMLNAQKQSLAKFTWKALYTKGQEAYKNKNYSSAQNWFYKAKLKAELTEGKANESYLASLSGLAETHQQTRTYKKAAKLLLEVLEIREKEMKQKPEVFAKSLTKFIPVSSYAFAFLNQEQTVRKSMQQAGSVKFGGTKINIAKGVKLNVNSKKIDTNPVLKASKQDRVVAWCEKVLPILREKSGIKSRHYAFLVKLLTQKYVQLAAGSVSKNPQKVSLYRDKIASLLHTHLPLYKQTFTIKDKNYLTFFEALNAIYDYDYKIFYLIGSSQNNFKISNTEGSLYDAYVNHQSILRKNDLEKLALLWEQASGVYFQNGDYRKAEESIKQAMAVRKKHMLSDKEDLLKRWRYVGTLLGLVKIYQTQQIQLKACESLLSEARALYPLKADRGFPLHPMDAKIAVAKSSFYNSLGLYDKAQQEFKDVAILFKGKDYITSAEHAEFLESYAYSYFVKQNYPDAEQILKKSLDIWKAVYNSDRQQIRTLQGLASIYEAQKQYDRALPLLTEALNMAKSLNANKTTTYTQSLDALAHLYFLQKKYDKALKLYEEMRGIQQKTLGEENLAYTQTIHNIALVYYQQQMFIKAAPLFEQMVKQVFTFLNTNLKGFSEKEQQNILRNYAVYLANYERFVVDYVTKDPTQKPLLVKLLNLRVATKAQVLNKRKKLQRIIFQSNDQVLLKKYNTYVDLKAKVATYLSLSKAERQQRGIKLELALQEIENLEKDIFQAVNLGNTQSQQANFRQLQQKLNSNEACIEMIRLASNESQRKPLIYAHLIVTKNTPYPQLVIIEQGQQLETTFAKAYQTAIKSQQKDNESYQRFWAPIANALQKQGIKKVYFSPDGVYHQVNLNTLRDVKSNSFVEENLDLRMITNLQEVVEDNGRKTQRTNINQASTQMVLVGRPDYGMPIAKLQQAEQFLNENQTVKELPASFDQKLSNKQFQSGKRSLRSGWSDLPGTEKEILAIEKVLKKRSKYQVVTRLKQQALEKAVKDVNSPKVLHIATHGFFIERIKKVTKVQKEEVSFDNFSRGNQASFSTQVTSQDPMLRSGIVLAGVSSYERATKKPETEDGVLTAYEASALDLRNTDLVVLSACETGLGEIENGEGVYGLQRAFIVAGAKSLLMSLWKVDDQATELLMSRFYSEWIGKKKTKREAFRAAQEYLRNYQKGGEKIYAAPYYWGAFVMVGE